MIDGLLETFGSLLLGRLGRDPEGCKPPMPLEMDGPDGREIPGLPTPGLGLLILGEGLLMLGDGRLRLGEGREAPEKLGRFILGDGRDGILGRDGMLGRAPPPPPTERPPPPPTEPNPGRAKTAGCPTSKPLKSAAAARRQVFAFI